MVVFQIRSPNFQTINSVIQKSKNPIPYFLSIHSYEIFDDYGDKIEYCINANSICIYMEYYLDTLYSDM